MFFVRRCGGVRSWERVWDEAKLEADDVGVLLRDVTQRGVT